MVKEPMIPDKAAALLNTSQLIPQAAIHLLKKPYANPPYRWSGFSYH